MSQAFSYEQVVFGTTWPVQRNDHTLGGLRLDRALAALEEHLGVGKARILEAGCGVGRFTAQLGMHLPNAHTTAFDLSQAAVTEAARRTCYADYAVADALLLPYTDNTFDAVIFFDLLEHLTRPASALAEFARVMRPCGVLHGYVPCEGQPLTLHWLLGRWLHSWTRRHAGHIQHPSRADLVALVEEAGFEIVDLQHSYYLLGQAMDVATFAARETIFRRRRGGQGQPEAFYDRSILGAGRLSRAYGTTRRAVEAAAYAEARVLGWCPWALGVHLTARRKPVD